ncbi:MAG: hypothetical protein NZ553_12380 [Caldilinea sp.]|nr:hypothetical protein [Caldilinea sp.]MDW8441265.1 hypothetical protein [Caldilineaceae bacterium]
MTAATLDAASVQSDGALMEFTEAFFSYFGASVQALPLRSPRGKRRNSVAQLLQIELSSELREHFGAASLRLAFRASHLAEAGEGVELVAPGSRVFDRMMAYLEQKSAVAVQRAPVRHADSQALMSAVRPTNAAITRLRLQERMRLLFAFTWRITYRADDKRQEIYTTWMDEEGRLLSQRDDEAKAASGRQNGTIDLDRLLREAEAAPTEGDTAGETTPIRLPALTQLVRLAERARTYAVYHADMRCVEYEAEILPRLYKVLNRLLTYYQQQIDEAFPARDPEGERRRALEADLQRKIAEELENHRLYVDVELIAYRVIELPVAASEITISNGVHEKTVVIELDRYSGALRRPLCYACGAETTTLTLDHHGHLTCEGCLSICAGCNDLFCASCGLAPCPVCGGHNCEHCGRMCWACGKRACRNHLGVCPLCGDEVCHACQAECAECEVQQCKSHLRADCVADAQGQQRLICPRCSVRCPGCQQFTAQIGVCTASGQRFCLNCLATCARCGRVVGPGYYQVEPGDRRPYCHECLQECPSCHVLTYEVATCDVCGRSGCRDCVGRCVVCSRRVCAEHSIQMPGCGHRICVRDLEQCVVCRGLVCPRCDPTCAICGALHCRAHVAGCVQCGQEYCSACVNDVGVCATCAGADIEGRPLERHSLAWPPTPEANDLIHHYRWRMVSNRRYEIYIGEGAMKALAIVVVERCAEGARVVRIQRFSALERLRNLLGI